MKEVEIIRKGFPFPIQPLLVEREKVWEGKMVKYKEKAKPIIIFSPEQMIEMPLIYPVVLGVRARTGREYGQHGQMEIFIPILFDHLESHVYEKFVRSIGRIYKSKNGKRWFIVPPHEARFVKFPFLREKNSPYRWVPQFFYFSVERPG